MLLKRLYVFYHGECAFCRRCREWLASQPAYVELAFHPFQSAEARRLCPELPRFQPNEQLIVLSDEGGIDPGESAWRMYLYTAAGPGNCPGLPCVPSRNGYACSSRTTGSGFPECFCSGWQKQQGREVMSNGTCCRNEASSPFHTSGRYGDLFESAFRIPQGFQHTSRWLRSRSGGTDTTGIH